MKNKAPGSSRDQISSVDNQPNGDAKLLGLEEELSQKDKLIISLSLEISKLKVTHGIVLFNDSKSISLL